MPTTTDAPTLTVDPELSTLAGDQPEATPVNRRLPEAERESWWERWHLLAAALACWAFLLLAFLLDHLTGVPHAAIIGLYVAAYLSGGTLAAKDALTDLFHGHANVDLLMVTAALGAATVDAWAEGAVLLGLFSSSNALEHGALERTRRAVRSLMELSPEVATLLRSDAPDGEALVPVEDLVLGDVVLIRPGERIPVDGEVIRGESAVDQSAITGESVPVTKHLGSSVFAATMNTTGAMQVRVTKLAQESTLAKIIAFVEEAREQKSRTQRFTDRFEGRYAVGVIVASALIWLIPWLVFERDFGDSFYRAMTLLVVASPCALVISTPASTLSGLANAARNGILFKGGNHLENAGIVRTVAFDKTGTLTEGRPRVTDVIAIDRAWSEERVLGLAASAERLSEHPLATAIVNESTRRGIVLEDAHDFEAIAGKGIVAHVDGHEVVVGNEPLFDDLGATIPERAHAAMVGLRDGGKTAMLVGDREAVRGVVAVADTVRPGAARVVADLKRLQIEHVVMLTGDNRRVANAIGGQLGITDVEADLLPEQKLETIRALMTQAPVAMVGDGVNDAPALATATVGVAMGGAGTDVALETADVVLMADDLTRLPYAIALSRRTRRTIVQNLTFSLAVIVTLITLALTIGIPLPLGVVGHEGSTVVVVLNGLRLLRADPMRGV
jgi:Cd2+/Zn2+-exporting ATPase